MSWPVVLALAAGLLQLTALLFAVDDTLHRRMQPSTTSFGIWTFVSATLLASSMAAGATSNLPFIVAGFAGTGSVFILSFKYGYRKWSWVDPVAVVLAVASLLIWYETKEAAYAIYILTLIDWIALLPIVRKTWKDPKSESRHAWLASLLSSICLCAAITEWRAAIVVVAATQLLHSTLINILIRWPHPTRSKKARMA